MEKFELYKVGRGFCFRLVEENGDILLSREGYTKKQHSQVSLESVRKNALKTERYIKLETELGEYLFKLRANNGNVLGTSMTFASAKQRDEAIDMLQSLDPEIPVVDLVIPQYRPWNKRK